MCSASLPPPVTHLLIVGLLSPVAPAANEQSNRRSTDARYLSQKLFVLVLLCCIQVPYPIHISWTFLGCAKQNGPIVKKASHVCCLPACLPNPTSVLCIYSALPLRYQILSRQSVLTVAPANESSFHTFLCC